MATPTEYVELVLKSDKFTADVQRLLEKTLQINVDLLVDGKAVTAVEEQIAEFDPTIEATVLVNEASAREAIAALESQRPEITGEVDIDTASVTAAQDAVEASAAAIDANLVDVATAAELAATEVAGIGESASALTGIADAAGVAATAYGDFAAAVKPTADELAELDERGAELTAMWQAQADALATTNSMYAVGVDVLAEYEAELAAATAATSAESVALTGATASTTGAVSATEALAAAQAELATATAESNSSLSASQLGFTRLGGSIGLLAGNLLGLPPILSVIIALVGRDLVKSVQNAVKDTETFGTTTLANAKRAVAAAQERVDAEVAADTTIEDAQADVAVSALAAEAAYDSLTAAVAVYGEASAEVAAQIALASAAEDAAIVSAEALTAAQAETVLADEALTAASVELAAAQTAQAAASEAASSGAVALGPILLGVAAAVTVAVVAYELFQDSTRKITDVSSLLGAALDKNISKLIDTGKAVDTAHTAFDGLPQSIALVDDAIIKAFEGKDVERFNTDIVSLGLNYVTFADQVKASTTGAIDTAGLLTKALGANGQPLFTEAQVSSIDALIHKYSDLSDARGRFENFNDQGERQTTLLSPEQTAAFQAAFDLAGKDADLNKALQQSFNDTLASSDGLTVGLLKQAEADNAASVAAGNLVPAYAEFTASLSDASNAIAEFQLQSGKNTDPAFLQAYQDSLHHTSLAQTELDHVTAAYGVTAKQAFAIGKKQLDDQTTAQGKADAQRLADLQKVQAAEAAATAAAVQRSAEIDSIEARLTAATSGSTGHLKDIIGLVGFATEDQLKNISGLIDQLNGQITAFANGITDKLFPTGATIVSQVGAFGKTSLDAIEAQFGNVEIHGQLQLDDAKALAAFPNTAKLFADIVANQGPDAADKFFANFEASTPERQAQFEKAGATYAKFVADQNDQWTSIGKAIGDIIAPAITKAITDALDPSHLTPTVQSAVDAVQQPDLNPQAQNALPASTVDDENRVQRNTQSALKAVQQLKDAITFINKTPVKIDTSTKGNAFKEVSDLQKQVAALEAAKVNVPIGADTTAADAAIRALQNKITALSRGFVLAGSTKLSFAGGDLAAGERSYVNELGVEGWLPRGASLDKLTILGGGQPWYDFTPKTAGTVINHIDLERLISAQRESVAAVAGHPSHTTINNYLTPNQPSIPNTPERKVRDAPLIEHMTITADKPGRARSEVEAALTALLRRVR